MSKFPVSQATAKTRTNPCSMRPSVRASMSAVPPANVRSQARSAVSTASQRPPTSATTSNTAPIRYSRRRPPPERLTQSRRVGCQPAFDLRAVHGERFLTRRLEAHDEHRLRIRGTQQPPSFREGDAHAVERKDRILRGEILGGALDDVELLLVRAVNAQLGRGVRLRQIGQELGQWAALARDVGEQPRGGEEGVVESVPVAAEEHVAAHFTRERCADLFHLLLDEGVTGLPHHRFEPGLLEHLRQHFRALHIEDDGLPLPHATREISAKQYEELIAEHRLPALVHGADTIAIAVEGDAELGLLQFDGGLEVVEVFEHGRIWMV